MQNKLTIQNLSNLVNYSWEVERAFGFYLEPERFKKCIEGYKPNELRAVLDSLAELFRTVHEIGSVSVELKVKGSHPFFTHLKSFQTPTAAALGIDENVVLPDENPAVVVPDA
jgi:hypothetical protein